MSSPINAVKAYKAINAEKFIIVDGVKAGVQRVNTQKHEPLLTIKGIVLHWTAGPKALCFDDYHYNVIDVAGKASVVQTLLPTQKGMHLYGRNTGMLGITVCAMQNPKLKSSLPTDAQIEAMALLCAEICCFKNLNPDGDLFDAPVIVNRIRTKEIFKAPVLSDHKYWAIKDSYYPDRWDIDTYMPIVLKKAIGYYKELKSNKRQFQFQGVL